MKKLKLIMYIFCLLFLSNCKNENKNCDRFKVPKSSKEVVKIIEYNKDIIIKEVDNEDEINTILNTLKNSCSEFIKFGSNNRLDFYDSKDVIFSITKNDDYFKYQGKVYKFEE